MFEDNRYTHTKEASQRDSGKICERFFADWCSYNELIAYHVDQYTHDYELADGTQVDVKARNWRTDDPHAVWWIQVRQTKMQTASIYVFFLFDRYTNKGAIAGAMSKNRLLRCQIVPDGRPLPTKNRTPAKGDCYIIHRQDLSSPEYFADYFYDRQRIILRENLDVENQTISPW